MKLGFYKWFAEWIVELAENPYRLNASIRSAELDNPEKRPNLHVGDHVSVTIHRDGSFVEDMDGQRHAKSHIINLVDEDVTEEVADIINPLLDHIIKRDDIGIVNALLELVAIYWTTYEYSRYLAEDSPVVDIPACSDVELTMNDLVRGYNSDPHFKLSVVAEVNADVQMRAISSLLFTNEHGYKLKCDYSVFPPANYVLMNALDENVVIEPAEKKIIDQLDPDLTLGSKITLDLLESRLDYSRPTLAKHLRSLQEKRIVSKFKGGGYYLSKFPPVFRG